MVYLVGFVIHGHESTYCPTANNHQICIYKNGQAVLLKLAEAKKCFLTQLYHCQMNLGLIMAAQELKDPFD